MSDVSNQQENADNTSNSNVQNVISPHFHGTIYTQHLHTGVGNINITESSNKGRQHCKAVLYHQQLHKLKNNAFVI